MINFFLSKNMELSLLFELSIMGMREFRSQRVVISISYQERIIVFIFLVLESEMEGGIGVVEVQVIVGEKLVEEIMGVKVVFRCEDRKRLYIF